MWKNSKAIAFAGASLAVMTAHAAFAQTPTSEGKITLEELIVTAQKRSEAANSVPMSITAVGGEQLARQGVHSGQDLVKLVPGLTFTQTQFDSPVYILRGVGFYESSLAANPAVSVYVDEVPLTYPAMTRGALLDLERVEVLKGPQGTLFGQNSTGGAINYIAAKPTAKPEAGVTLSYGSFDTANLESFISGPITDTLGGRAAISVTEGGPWQRSRTRDAELGDTDEIVGRVLLEWRPTDTLDLTLNVNGWRDKSESQAAQFVAVQPAVPGVPLPPGLLAQPPARDDAREADWDPGVDFHRDNTFFQAALRGDWKASDDITLTSITSFERYTRRGLNDADGSSAPDIVIGLGGNIKSFSQELRLTGDTSPRLHWIAGANYQRDEILDLQPINIEGATNSQLFGLSFGPFVNTTQNTATAKAVFANLTYGLTSELNLQAGARYTRSENAFSGCTADSGDGRLSAVFNVIQSFFPATVIAQPGGCVTIVDPLGDVGTTRSTLKEDNVSWRVGLDWKPDGGTLLYANVSQGYKAGNFPNLSASSAVQFEPVTQEKLLAYEAGFKKSLADHTVQLNGAVYYYSYDDKQLRGRVQDPLFGLLEKLVNIPKSHIVGAELQAQWAPIAGLQLGAAAAYTKSRVDEFSGFNQSGQIQDFADSAFPYTPEFTLLANANYRWPETHGVVPFAGLNVTHNSKTFGGLGEPSDLRLNAYTLLDLQGGVESADGRWRAFLWGHNVTDEFYLVNSLVLNDSRVRYTGRPATFGITLSYRH